MPLKTVQSIPPIDQILINLRRKKIPGLDGIRGIAALTVVGMHDQELAHHDWFGRFYPGRFAVQIFFVISGLLITWLLLQEERRDGKVDRTTFYWRRVFRLFPALALLLVWQYFTRIPETTRGGLVATAFYFANYYSMFDGGARLGGLGQTWSLAVEEHFYLIWPQVFVLVRNKRNLLKGCLLVAVLQIVWRLGLGLHGDFRYAALATETASCAALVGCALALILWRCPGRLPSFIFQPILAPLSIAVILALGQLPANAQLSWGVPLGIPFIAILVLQAVTYEWWLLENPVALYLGRISYSVYLWGMVAIALVQRLGHDRFHLPVFAVAILLGSISHFLIERPLQSFGRRWIVKPRAAIISSPAY